MKFFISYSWVDSTIVDDVVKLFKDLAIDYFLDKKDIKLGQSITEAVDKSMNSCTHILIVISKQTEKSWWVPYELGRATEKGLIVIPLIADSDAKLPSFLQDTLAALGVHELKKHLKSYKILNNKSKNKLDVLLPEYIKIKNIIDDKNIVSQKRIEFVMDITKNDMNSKDSEFATREFIECGPIVLPEIFELLKHSDSRVRYWSAWALVALFRADHLLKWLEIKDENKYYRNILKEALPGLRDLAALKQFEILVDILNKG